MTSFHLVTGAYIRATYHSSIGWGRCGGWSWWWAWKTKANSYNTQALYKVSIYLKYWHWILSNHFSRENKITWRWITLHDFEKQKIELYFQAIPECRHVNTTFRMRHILETSHSNGETFLPGVNTIKTQNFIFIPHGCRRHVFIVTMRTNIQPM